jgi:hypothetical protein
MFKVQLYGSGRRRDDGRFNLSGAFATLTEAIDVAESTAASTTCYWGKATDYRIIGASGVILLDAELKNCRRSPQRTRVRAC